MKLVQVDTCCEARCQESGHIYRNDPNDPCLFLDKATGNYYHKSSSVAPKQKAKAKAKAKK